MLEKIANKTTKEGNYKVSQLSKKELADMTQSDIIDAPAILIMKDKPRVQVISVKNKSILEQTLCPLPVVNASEINTLIRYINVLPNGRPLISYFGATPDSETLASLIKLAKTARNINGGIFPGYSMLTSALGDEKHFSLGLAIQKGMANIRVLSKNEMAFTFEKAVKKMTIENFVNAKWETELVGSFETKVLFMDRIQNGVTNVVTEDKIVQGYNLLTKKVSSIQDQSSKLKVFSFVQWHKNAAVVATPLGLTKQPAIALAI